MTKDLNQLEAYDFGLPGELIAQQPCTPRDESRLLIVDRRKGSLEEIVFRDLSALLQTGDSFVFNDTRVIPARLMGNRESGAKIEVFLTRPSGGGLWQALVKPGRKMEEGARVIFGADFAGKVIEVLPDGQRLMQFEHEGDFAKLLEKYGQTPLPPYIRKGSASEKDSENYQTIFAAHPGAVAAPTAGLHFTERLLNEFAEKGVSWNTLTLHVGLGTFLPVQTEDIRQHPMHAEYFAINQKTAVSLNRRVADRRQICVGTTCCRALESSVNAMGKIEARERSTNIFIYPGYEFRYVDALLTNFHLPKSTLLMLVSALAGYELIREAYAYAIANRFRFYSYGDAMLIL